MPLSSASIRFKETLINTKGQTSPPLFFVHRGNPEYLSLCLQQARHANPSARLILLGDETNRGVLASVEHHLLSDYFDSALSFEAIYRHISPNSPEGELICIQRWFVLRDFCQKNGIDAFFHFDSDVLIYSNLSQEASLNNLRSQYDYCLTETSGHSSFFSSRKALNQFCDFIVDFYRDTKTLDLLEEAYKQGRSFQSLMGYPGGFLQDMALLTCFSQKPTVRSIDLSVPLDGVAMNLVISHPRCDRYCNAGQSINVTFCNRQPYAVTKDSGELVRFYALHFQGGMKRLMDAYTTFDKDSSWTSPILDLEQARCVYGFPTEQLAPRVGLLRRVIRKAKKLAVALFSPSE